METSETNARVVERFTQRTYFLVYSYF